jgi:hypothetical protein
VCGCPVGTIFSISSSYNVQTVACYFVSPGDPDSFGDKMPGTCLQV